MSTVRATGGRSHPGRPRPDSTFVYRRTIRVSAPAPSVYGQLERIGGTAGWPYANALWQIRGLIDRIVGGPGMRGRADGLSLAEGEVLDFWRVEIAQAPRQLRLRAEMRLPGRGWLDFSIEPDSQGAHLRETATFEAAGLGGRLYWYVLFPIHAAIFRGTLTRLGQLAERSGDPLGS